MEQRASSKARSIWEVMEMHRSSGFTLVELLIVVAIIGIITAVAVPSLLSAVDRSRSTGTMANMDKLAEAIQMYEIDHVGYPEVGSLSALEDVGATLAPFLQGEYMPKDLVRILRQIVVRPTVLRRA